MSVVETETTFPFAPTGWTQAIAQQLAKSENLATKQDHWDAVSALQEYYQRHEGKRVNVRELHDALDERFHHKGGMKYLYILFPSGPVAQGCRLAGLEPPAGAIDKGFGSVV